MERGHGISSIENGSVDDALARSGVLRNNDPWPPFFAACLTGAGGERYLHYGPLFSLTWKFITASYTGHRPR